MAISFDNALGITPKALLLRNQRSEILAANLANSDTPGYKARDIDFLGMLRGEVEAKKGLALAVDNPRHIEVQSPDDSTLLYRNPQQPSIDGNTVDAADEQVRFSQNSVQYMTSLRFLGDTFKGMMSAVTGQ